jgi:hypothetical protein
MSMEDLIEVLQTSVVDKINNNSNDNTAMILAAMKENTASISQQLDISAKSQAQSQFEDADQVANEIARLQKIAARLANE